MNTTRTWLDNFVDFCHDQVDDRVREALWSRGVSDEQIKLFKLGYVNKTLPFLEGAEQFLEWAGNGRKLNNLLVFPLTNPLGQVMGLQFRSVDPECRGYMDYIAEKAQPVLFGLGQAMESIWETGKIWLVEGSFDLFPTQRVMPNVVSTLTARVPDNFVPTLRRLVTEIFMFYDEDIRGRKGSQSFQRRYSDEFKVHIPSYSGVSLVDGKSVKDPCNLWEAWGDDRFGSFLRCIESTNLVE